MDEIIYTLSEPLGGAWLASADDGHPALLLPDPGVDHGQLPLGNLHPVLATLEGWASIDGTPWLAYRWAAGVNLAHRLSGLPLQPIEAVSLLLRVLDGVAHARLAGLSLGALLAERIVIHDGDEPLLAAVLPAGTPGEDPIAGAGRLLFHLLFGMPLADLDPQVLHDLSGLELDPQLASLLHGALGEAGAPHFEHVLDLRAALRDYLDAQQLPEPPSADDGGPVDQLLRRMGRDAEFPSLSRAVGAINRLADADSERLQGLSSLILRDFALTNKVLRLANSASFGQFGGATSTISRAVMVLGFNAIKSLAMTVMLIEHLGNHQHADELKDEVARAFFSSLVARKLAERCGFHDLEEARVAGMFHHLGRLLALFFSREEAQAALAEIAGGESDDVAACRHLGASFEVIGAGVARVWNLPDKLIASMAPLQAKPAAPRSEGEWLRLFANAASQLMAATFADTEPERTRHFLLARELYAEPLHLAERDLRLAMDEAVRDTIKEAAIFGMAAPQGGALARLRQLAGLPELDAPRSAEPAVPQTAAEQASVEPAATVVSAVPDSVAIRLASHDRPEVVAALAACVQEVSETLVSDFKLNDLLRMILETLFRSLAADRVLLATRSVQRNAIVGRFGFGEQIGDFSSGFVVPLDDSADVLRGALAGNMDMLVDDCGAAAMRERISPWFRQLNHGRSFLLLPIVLDRKIVGLFYVDCNEPFQLKLGSKELALAKTLRNQAILAIRQKTPVA
ncbi:HDOD domain-containing protein [Chitinimonas sp.]|uniref:HDOD domain-containing protein n=1 Tax=Chitinimonas sp. TaxID=1934313 RepID=UPI0035B3655C